MLNSRKLRTGTLLAVLAAAAAGCTSLPLPPGVQGLPRLYISDVSLRVRGDQHFGEANASEIDRQIAVLRQRRDMGVFITPTYIFTVDPVLLVQTTSHRTIPAEELVEEPAFDDSATVSQQRVLRNPLFFLERAVIKYNIHGYEGQIPDQVVNLNYAMKQTFAVLDRLPVSYAEKPIRALWDRPDTTPPAAGTVEVIIEGQDLDPLLSKDARKVTASRAFPVLYSYGSILLNEVVADNTPLTIPQPAIFPSPVAATPAP